MSTRHPANRLARETSPYLLQHAHNPVDWYPWGEEAFQKAREENKPIFLSVGYSACHWCHVMERESFENEDIAALLNRHYVCIKVDREERPDVDQIYMAAVQLITQRGGWPMSVFMTPDGKPFYGGTYWPPTSRMGMPGFKDLILKLNEYWVSKKAEVDTSADQLAEAIGRVSNPDHGQAGLSVEILQKAMEQLIRSADRRHGGFGGAPKFPHPMDIRVLLRCWQRFQNNDALLVARLTLEKMANGGIYDQLGGGFHRYSTDAHWLVPHFEKMLYDNALLVPAYLEMYQISGEEFFATVVRETLDYILREMTQPEGGFYSTQDADSEGEEGKFFVWSEEEINDVLGADDGHMFSVCYDVSLRGNWEGQNILNRPKPLADCAQAFELSEGDLKSRLAACRQKLFEVRQKRIAPGRDDKVLTAWNGMMISAFAQAAQVLDEPRYADAASQAVKFIRDSMLSADGRLLHSYKDGQARFMAYLDDYACLIDGLTHLYEATGDGSTLDWAAELAGQMIEHYADEEAGGFFYTANDHEQLIARTKDSQDNATPSGNGMAATALLRLGELCTSPEFSRQGEQTLQMLSGLLAEHPRAAGQALLALDFLVGPSPVIVIVDGPETESSRTLKKEVTRRFLPNRLVIHGGESTPLLKEHFNSRPPQESSTAYVCLRGTCLSPVSDTKALKQALDGAIA